MDLSQYLEIFIDESKEHLQTLNDQVLILESEPENVDTVNEIFRAAHSLKGMTGTMGYKRMQRLTHDMENVFSEIRNGKMNVNADLVDIVFKCLDALEGYLTNIIETSDEGTEDNDELIAQLNAVLQNGLAGSGEAQAAATKEETKEEKKPEGGDRRKYLSIPLADFEKNAISEAKAQGMHVYATTVYIQETCLLKAARAFLVFKGLENKGEIIKSVPSVQDIEDEKFDLDFSMFIISDKSLEEVKKAIENVSEIEEAVIEEYELKEEEPAQTEAKEEEKKPEETVAKAAAPEKKEEKKPAGKSGKPVVNRSVRVDIEKLDDLMNQVSELIIAKNGLVSVTGTLSSQDQSFNEQIEYLERITTNLHESVMKVRMVPIESVVNKFPRMIRDLSRKLNKKMELYMTGEDTELDRTVVDQIGDPLQHLLRNSADHGLEDNETRVALGKPEVGSIFLNAFQEGNNVIIQVGDDGAGIDVAAVRDKAIERGIITEEQAESMSQKDIINILFLPSFSMSKTITDISGRGVGLDVVKSNIEALGGDVEVKTAMGEGTTFTVRLPLTLAIIQALMVEVRDEKYAIALGSISNIEDIPVKDIKYVEAQEVIHLRGKVIPLVRLDNVLDLEPREEPESLTVVIVTKGDSMAGLVVDNLIGQQEIVIKSLGKYIDNNKLISGATILGDGEVALILDVNTLM